MSTPVDHASSSSAVTDASVRPARVRRGNAGARATRPGWIPVLCGVLVVIAVVLWWVSLSGIDLSGMGGLGLVDVFPIAFYLAVGLVIASMIIALVARTLSRFAVFAAFGALILVIYGTPAVVFSEPEYAWVYKHLGVIRYLEVHGSTNRLIDIYQNWPAFFAANAWLSRATGIDPGRYAAWAPVFFEVCLLAAVLYALGGIIADPRRRYAAAFVWLLGSWIGQDYLSPQAMGIVLVIVALGIVLRIGAQGGWDHAPVTALGRVADRWRARAGHLVGILVRVPRTPGPAAPAGDADAPQAVPDDPADRAAAAYPRRDLAVGIVLFSVLAVAVIISHQLSPVMLIMSLVVLALVTGWRRLWPVIVGVVALEAVWLALAWTTVQKFGLLNIDGPVTPVQAGTGTPLPGVSLVQLDARAIGVAFWALAAVGLVRMLRRTGTDPSTPLWVAALAFTPYLIVPVQSYGGEAGLRAYLFSLPWLAVLGLEAIWPSGERRVAARAVQPAPGPPSVGARLAGVASARRPWLLVVLAPLLVAALIVAYYGQSLSDWMSPSDVAAAQWVETNAPAGSVIYSLSPGLPDKSTARYPLLRDGVDALTDTESTLAPLLVPSERLNGVRTALNDIPPENAPYLANIPAQVDYLVITPSERNYARMEGLMSGPQVDGLIADLRAASDFTVVYDHAGSIIFRYIPGT